MTSHRIASSKMQASTREKRKGMASSYKEKCHITGDRPVLPLSKKLVYMDVKQGKQAKTLEEQLKKLGATVEKFLSREINYVISSFGPTKQEERTSTGEDNPQSPSFVPSPFSCGPSPTATTDPKKNLVSRGKALAQIACARNQTTSSVVSSAEKMGIKVVSVEAASKWLDKELKKIEKDCSKDKKENSQEQSKKAVKKKRKVLKGAYIKFEACSRMYRPIKSELDRWPKLNPLAPPGLNPFTDLKMKMPNIAVRRQLLRGKKASRGMVSSSKARMKKCSSRSASKDSGMIKSPNALPDLCGVPITTTGDVKRNIENHWKKRPDKLQGYCECCEEKYKDLNQHLNNEDHRSFARNKCHYESLDSLISEICPAVDFLQNLILQHCSQKQFESQPKGKDKQLREALPALNFNVASPVSSIKTGNVIQEDIVALDMCTPQLDRGMSSDGRQDSDASSCDEEGDGKKADKRPQAVVIRRPTPSGMFTSPRRRQPTPSKKQWMPECSMIIGNSALGSLQPSIPFSQINFTVSETVLANPYAENVKVSGAKENGFIRDGCERDGQKFSSARSDRFSPTWVCGPRLSVKSAETKEDRKCLEAKEVEEVPEVKGVEESAESKDSEGTIQECLPSYVINKLRSDLKADGHLTLNVPENTAADSVECPSSQELASEKPEIESKAINTLREIQNISEQEVVTVPCIADRVKTRTRKNINGGKCEEKVHHLSFTDLPSNVSEEQHNIVLGEIEQLDEPVVYDSISSGKSKQEGMPPLSRTSAGLDKCGKLSDDVVERVNGEKDCVLLKDIEKCTENQPCDRNRRPHKEAESNQPSPKPLQDQSPDSATKLQPKSKRRKVNKSINRNLFAEPSGQKVSINNISVMKSPEKDEFGSRNLENCSRNRRLKKRNISATKTMSTTDNPEARSTPNISNRKSECMKSSERMSEDNVASSIRGNVRQCRLFVHEGVYKEGNVVLLTDSEKEHPKVQSRMVNGEEDRSQDFTAVGDDCNSDSFVDDRIESDMQQVEHVSGKVSRQKSFKKKTRTSVDWNRRSSGGKDDECNPDGVKLTSPSKLVVPNIAERVKRRRSCTQFNHEGQYANDGEGTEETTPKVSLSKGVNKHRRLLKAKKRLWYDLSVENIKESDDLSSSNRLASTEDTTEKTTEPTLQLSSSRNKKSGKSNNAIVIRRGKASFNALSKTDANWCKYLSDKDWSQCETDGSCFSSECDAEDRQDFPSKPTGGHNQTSSSAREKESVKRLKESSQRISSADDSSAHHKHDKDSNVPGDRLSSLKKAVRPLRFQNMKLPKTSCLLKGSQPRSPKLRLRIHRNPIDASYSSTLEEIHDDKCVAVDTFNNDQALSTSPVNKEENSISPSPEDLDKASECDRPSPATPPDQLCRTDERSPQQEVGEDRASHSPQKEVVSQRKSGCLQQKKVGENKSNYERSDNVKDPDLRSSSRERKVRRKSTGRLKMRRSGSETSKRKRTSSEGQEIPTADGGNCEENVATDAQREGIEEDDEIVARSNMPLAEKHPEEDRVDEGLRPPVSKAVVSIDQKVLDSNEENNNAEDDSEKSRRKEEGRLQKSLKQKSKKSVKRERSASREDSLHASKKVKISKGVTGDNSSVSLGTNSAFGNSLPCTSGDKYESHELSSPESDATEVDFPNLHLDKKANTHETKVTVENPQVSLIKKACRKHDKGMKESENESGAEEKSQVGCLEDNTQTSLYSNLGDYLTFIPTFSSPGKTNSSWDDACDSYLNTSAKSDHTPGHNLNTSATADFSPSRLPASRPGQPCSSGLKSPRKTAKGYFSPDLLSQFTSPVKKRPTGTADCEMSPVIEKVDSVISFNYMSPQRLQFSPNKCEKSISHRRNLNSPSNNV